MMKKIVCLTLLVGVFAIINNLPSASAFPEEEHLLVKRQDEAPEPEDGGDSENADGGEGGEELEDESTEGDAPEADDEEDPSTEEALLEGDLENAAAESSA